MYAEIFQKLLLCVGIPDKQFSIKQCDTGSAHYEAFTASMLSTESTDFYITGLEKTRLEKVDFISKFPITYDNLNVCYYGENNCGHCEKCVRTQFELMALGKLELYKNVLIFRNFTETRTNIWTMFSNIRTRTIIQKFSVL